MSQPTNLVIGPIVINYCDIDKSSDTKYASKPDKTDLAKRVAEFHRFRFNNRRNMQIY
jgi:hypothetical protein